MSKEKLVVALGGNALGNDVDSQRKIVAETAVPIVDLVEAGYPVVLAHGNGPQVGMINLAFGKGTVDGMPFPECGAMSQGYIGYHLQNALTNELRRRGIQKSCATVVSQVVVDSQDPAFQSPSKPIGAFYTHQEARELAFQHPNFVFKEDSGRGWRRVVPSPKPADILEREIIRDLFQQGHLVIAVGGGGIPVVDTPNGYKGVPAVVDKDFASAKLAQLIDADRLIILTAVEYVAIRFGKPDQKNLEDVTVEELERYAQAGEFAKGSMLPKVEAALEFCRSRKGRTALITSLDKAKEALQGKTGTRIH